jgi:hypothetical protein
MSAPNFEGPQAEIHELRERVHNLSRMVSVGIERAQRKRKIYLSIGVILVGLMVVSFTTLTSMAFRLDAEALAQIGRHEVERNLPASREAMKEYLERRAPELTSHLLGVLVGSMPQIRPLILREMDDSMRDLTKEFEDKLISMAHSGIRSAKSDLDSNTQGMGDVEKIDFLVSAVAKEFTTNMDLLLAELYPKFSREIVQVRAYLVGLRDKDPSQLTPRQRTEREIVETLLKLIAHEQKDGPPSRF